MSLLDKVKTRIQKARTAGKIAKQRKQEFEVKLAEARLQGEQKGMLERTKREAYVKARRPPKKSVAGMKDLLGKMGGASERGLDFMNKDLFGMGNMGNVDLDFGIGSPPKKKKRKHH